MSSNDATPSGGRSTSRTSEEMANQIESLRSELASLRTHVVKAANTQVDAMRDNLEERIRQNPLGAVAIAAGVGFLYAIIRR